MSRKRGRRPNEDISPAVAMETILDSNFEELARRYPEFGVIWKTNSKLKTPEVRLALTKTLLQAHWNLSLSSVPDYYLCPPIPNRYFYVRWILDQVLPITDSPGHFAGDQSGTQSAGALDIGTGAFAIYPLLMAANCSNIPRIFASDVDESTLECAKQHIALNHLQSRISLFLVPPTQRQQNAIEDLMDTGEVIGGRGPLCASLEQIRSTFGYHCQLQVSMTNPPFYDLCEVPISQTNMTQNEGHYPGGEMAFGMDMVVDGLHLFLTNHTESSSFDPSLRPPVWNSTMCGKKSSFVMLRNMVTQLLGPGHVCVGEFGPGSLTRWFLAWTFTVHPNAQSPLARHDAFTFGVPGVSASEVADRLQEYSATFPWGALKCIAADATGKSFLMSEAFPPPPPASWKGDEELPSVIRNMLTGHEGQRNLFLPREGHFCIHAKCTNHYGGIQVDFVSYIHSENGRKIVDKIRGQIEGEIRRTNRRWRRKLKAAS